ncbi:MAG: hypothetical protein ACRDSJ_01875 [Rubrobacteraceae bacterium]
MAGRLIRVAHPKDAPFPWRQFGRSPDKQDFVVRHVDLLGRSLETGGKTDPDAILRKYLSEGRSETARRLSEKAVVLLEPTDQLGAVVWPVRPTRDEPVG